LLLGDIRQLKQFSQLPYYHEEKFEGRLHHLLDSVLLSARDNSQNDALVKLNVQYRSSERIGQVLQWFYDYDILHRPSDGEGPDYLYFVEAATNMEIKDKRVMVLNVLQSNGERELEDLDDSCYTNHSEMLAIVELAERIIAELLKRRMYTKRILILTPYNEQRKLIDLNLEARRKRYSHRHVTIEVELLTVDSSQGKESHVVILSMVRRNSLAQIGFMRHSYSRFLVGMSRAKDYLFLVMNNDTYRGKPGVWQQLTRDFYGDSWVAPLMQWQGARRSIGWVNWNIRYASELSEAGIVWGASLKTRAARAGLCSWR